MRAVIQMLLMLPGFLLLAGVTSNWYKALAVTYFVSTVIVSLIFSKGKPVIASWCKTLLLVHQHGNVTTGTRTEALLWSEIQGYLLGTYWLCQHCLKVSRGHITLAVQAPHTHTHTYAHTSWLRLPVAWGHVVCSSRLWWKPQSVGF